MGVDTRRRCDRDLLPRDPALSAKACLMRLAVVCMCVQVHLQQPNHVAARQRVRQPHVAAAAVRGECGEIVVRGERINSCAESAEK